MLSDRGAWWSSFISFSLYVLFFSLRYDMVSWFWSGVDIYDRTELNWIGLK